MVIPKEEKTIVQPAPQETIAQPVVAIITPPPTKPSIKKMRVVHINELGNYEEEPTNAVAYSAPSLDIRKMKVVSIYDVQNEAPMWQAEQDMPVIVRINRPQISGFTLPYSFNSGNPYSQSFAQNKLTIRLNRNN